MVYQAKIPDIEKCLDVVVTLKAKKGSGEVCLVPLLPQFMNTYGLA